MAVPPEAVTASPTARRYATHDHLGSTRSLYDDSIGLVASYGYTPYGDLLHASKLDATTELFTGHTWDAASALYFAPFRYYSPAMARWTTRDPLGMVDGANLYAYVGGNPINYSDALGLWKGICISDQAIDDISGANSLHHSYIPNTREDVHESPARVAMVEKNAEAAYEETKDTLISTAFGAIGKWFSGVFAVFGGVRKITDTREIKRIMKSKYGIEPWDTGKRLEKIKQDSLRGMGPKNRKNPDIYCDPDGNVYNVDTGELLGFLGEGGPTKQNRGKGRGHRW